jgi:hypothetical protein
LAVQRLMLPELLEQDSRQQAGPGGSSISISLALLRRRRGAAGTWAGAKVDAGHSQTPSTPHQPRPTLPVALELIIP